MKKEGRGANYVKRKFGKINGMCAAEFAVYLDHTLERMWQNRINSIPRPGRTTNQEIEDIVAKEASELIQENKDNPLFVILDVRTPEEFSEGHIESATNVDYNSETFREKLDQLDKDKTYLMHCRSGARSSKALPIMEELGFLKIYHMTDGIDGWKAGGFPVVPSP